MQKNSLFDEQVIPWFKTKTFKVFVLVLAILSIATVVLFSEQIGNVLDFLGIRAATESREILIDGVGSGESNHSSFLEGVYTLDPSDSFTIDDDKRLVLNPN